nr:hypothetical protein B0A51_14408 [Rachicladosporium sp. CCFEE 5018]
MEIAIAKQAFDIDFTKVISFSGVRGTQYYALQQFDRRLNSAIFQLPSVWTEQHLGHLGNSGWVGSLAKTWAKTDAFEHEGLQKHGDLFEPGQSRPPLGQTVSSMTSKSTDCLDALDALQNAQVPAGSMTVHSPAKRHAVAKRARKKIEDGVTCPIPRCTKKYKRRDGQRIHLKKYHNFELVFNVDSEHQCAYGDCDATLNTPAQADEHLVSAHGWNINLKEGLWPNKYQVSDNKGLRWNKSTGAWEAADGEMTEQR